VHDQAASPVPAGSGQVAAALSGVRHAKQTEAKTGTSGFTNRNDEFMADSIVTAVAVKPVAAQDVFESEKAAANTGGQPRRSEGSTPRASSAAKAW